MQLLVVEGPAAPGSEVVSADVVNGQIDKPTLYHLKCTKNAYIYTYIEDQHTQASFNGHCEC